MSGHLHIRRQNSLEGWCSGLLKKSLQFGYWLAGCLLSSGHRPWHQGFADVNHRPSSFGEEAHRPVHTLWHIFFFLLQFSQEPIPPLFPGTRHFQITSPKQRKAIDKTLWPRANWACCSSRLRLSRKVLVLNTCCSQKYRKACVPKPNWVRPAVFLGLPAV